MRKQNKLIPFASINIDIQLFQLLSMSKSLFKSHSRSSLDEKISSCFLKDASSEQLLSNLCVRSSLDLILQSYSFSPGSEILMTCINIPSMAQIVRYHSLIPVPIQIDFDTLAPPNLDQLQQRITKNTKAIIISYIYGCDYQSNVLIDWAKQNQLIIIEDLAESFKGLKYTGNMNANFSMFSFGTIKTCTAFGGAILIVRNNKEKFQQIKDIYDSYQPLSNAFFRNRIFKNLFAIFALNTQFGNSSLRKLVNIFKMDYKEKMIGLVRGFPGSDDFLSQFRQQAPMAMLYLLCYRLTTYQNSETMLATIKQLNAQDYLMKNGVKVPGNKVNNRAFWLFPILVPENQVDFCYEELNKRGVDAYKGATQLQVIGDPVGFKYQQSQVNLTNAFFKNFLYMPIHKAVPDEQIKLICQQIIEVVKFAEQISGAQNKNIKQYNQSQSQILQSRL